MTVYCFDLSESSLENIQSVAQIIELCSTVSLEIINYFITSLLMGHPVARNKFINYRSKLSTCFEKLFDLNEINENCRFVELNQIVIGSINHPGILPHLTYFSRLENEFVTTSPSIIYGAAVIVIKIILQYVEKKFFGSTKLKKVHHCLDRVAKIIGQMNDTFHITFDKCCMPNQVTIHFITLNFEVLDDVNVHYKIETTKIDFLDAIVKRI